MILPIGGSLLIHQNRCVTSQRVLRIGDKDLEAPAAEIEVTLVCFTISRSSKSLIARRRAAMFPKGFSIR